MANLTGLVAVIDDLFDVIAAVLSNMVELITGDLLVFIIVGAVVGFIVWLISTYLIGYLKSSTVKMRK